MRKKLCLAAVIITVMILLVITASAQSGDVCGKIYSTDILALVNGQPIESYNIGGKTVIIAEDLYDYYDGYCYGYYVDYNKEHRLLTLSSYYFNITDYYFIRKEKSITRGKVGTVLGDVYETDIKVVCNSHEIKGYNIGGKTAICIEDLGTLDDSANNKFGYSKYLANCMWDEETRTIELNTPYPNRDEVIDPYSQSDLHHFKSELADNVLTVRYDPLNDYYSGSLPLYEDLSLSGADDKSSDNFISEYFVLEPFYIEINDKKYEAGLRYISKSWRDRVVFYHINDVEETKKMLMSAITLRKTYDEAIKYLYDHPDYSVLQRLDSDDYTVLTLFVQETGGTIYVAVKKTGGYLKFADYSRYYSDSTITVTLEGNIARISVYPFAGPHGATTMRCDWNLDDMQF